MKREYDKEQLQSPGPDVILSSFLCFPVCKYPGDSYSLMPLVRKANISGDISFKSFHNKVCWENKCLNSEIKWGIRQRDR